MTLQVHLNLEISMTILSNISVKKTWSQETIIMITITMFLWATTRSNCFSSLALWSNQAAMCQDHSS